MSETLKVLNNIRTLRAQSRELSLTDLEEILEKFSVVVAERKEEVETEAAQTREKEEKLSKYREMLIADGIDPGELLGAMEGGKKEQNVLLARLNINIPMRTAKKNHGPVRAVRQLRSKNCSIRVKNSKTF